MQKYTNFSDVKMAIFGHSFVANIPREPFKGYNVKIFGIPGERARSILSTKIFNDLTNFNPKFCYVQIGGNDINSTSLPKDTASDIYKVYKELKIRGIAVVFGEVMPRPDPYTTTPQNYKIKRNAVNSILRNTFKKNELLKYNNIDSTCFIRDGVHLNNKGYRIFVNGIKNQLNKFIKSLKN